MRQAGRRGEAGDHCQERGSRSDDRDVYGLQKLNGISQDDIGHILWELHMFTLATHGSSIVWGLPHIFCPLLLDPQTDLPTLLSHGGVTCIT
jgi:hypothetical protein